MMLQIAIVDSYSQYEPAARVPDEAAMLIYAENAANTRNSDRRENY